MPWFLVDRDLPRTTPEGLVALQHAEELMGRRLAAAGYTVRYIRSIFVLGESRCLCLFEAADEDLVAQLNDAAGLPYTRIVEVLDLDPPRLSVETLPGSPDL
ncbi:MAG: hypothetical protein KatS3mg057_0024 [Herpetosiphonaceae bacterium]|nr:MAG: hypothetical protein KatS3mg057_0024 [Herpetosiphonaceae bacterium]